jgi:hypothetical protein
MLMGFRNPQRGRSRARLVLAGVALAAGLAAPAAAQGVIATGSGRGGAIVAWGVALAGVIAGGLARARSGRSAGSGRDGAIVALVLALMGMALAGLHIATTSGAFYGAGNGRAGAIVALVLGGIGVVLGRGALARSNA